MFISVDIQYQLKSLLSNADIFDNLRLKHTETQNEVMTDVYDGVLYKNAIKAGVDFKLTYNFNVDGAPIFTSSRLSMWPIQLIINELPPKDRFRNTIFAGIWVGRFEPESHLINTFLKSFVEQSKKLFTEGLTLQNPTTKASVNLKVLPLLSSVDTVARPVLQNRVQFNGYSSCSWCYHPGVPVNGVIKYPVIDGIELRSRDSHLEDLKTVVEEGYTHKIRGVKGPSILLALPYFDIVWSLPPDYMHGVLLGVVRQLWDLWTTYSPENRFLFYLSPKKVEKLNMRLLQIKPPSEIHRLPRSLKEKSKWKASEWRSWLLFYSIPCLRGILNDKYLAHFALLVKAIACLLQKEIKMKYLEPTENDLYNFVKQFQQLYGQAAMTFNVHALLHLTESVRRSGPLWASSTFPYESEMFHVKEQVHGPVGVMKQIANRIQERNTFLNSICSPAERLDEKVVAFCRSMFSKGEVKVFLKNEGATYLGVNFPNDIFAQHSFTPPFESRNSFFYKRCIYKEVMYHSIFYSRTNKSSDSLVQIGRSLFMRIYAFVLSENRNYVFGECFNINRLTFESVKLRHMYQIADTENRRKELAVVPLSDIRGKCVYIETNIGQYVCTFPNTLEIQ